MKYLKLVFIFVLVLLMTDAVFAQKNVVRLGLGGLGYRNINLDFERALKENQAISLNLGILIPRTIPSALVEDVELDFNDLKGISIAPEYRFYTGSKKALNGFYIAPYLKYSSYGISASGSYDGTYGDVSAKFSTLGGGMQLGTQWLINDRVSIDWSFFGIGLNRNTLSMRFETNDNEVDFENIEDDMRAGLDDLPNFITKSIKTESGSDYAKIKAPVFLPAFRSNLSIGIAF